MDRFIFLYLACILSGFALLKVPLVGAFSSLHPIVTLVAMISIVVFSVVILVKGVLALLGK